MVVWSVDTRNGRANNLEIRHRVLDAQGHLIKSEESIVMSRFEGNHWLGSVACDSENRYLVVGSHSEVNDSFGVFAQLFDQQQALGEIQVVNERSEGSQVYPVAAYFETEEQAGWVIVYEDEQFDPLPQKTVYAQN